MLLILSKYQFAFVTEMGGAHQYPLLLGPQLDSFPRLTCSWSWPSDWVWPKEWGIMMYITQKPGLWSFSHNPPCSLSSQISQQEAEDPLTDFEAQRKVELSEGGSWVPEWLHETNSFCSSINHIGLQCEQGTPLPCLGLRFCSCLLQQSEYSYKYTYREGILGEKYLTLSGVPGNMVPRWTLPREINWSCISPSPKGPQKANQIIGCHFWG